MCLNFVVRRRGRPLADHIDEATGIGLPIKAGRRAFQHLQPFQTVGFDLRHREREAVLGQPQTIQILRGIESPHLETVEEGVGAVALNRNTRCILKRVLNCLRALILDLVFRHDRDGLRCYQQRSVSLRRRHALPGGVAHNRTGTTFADLSRNRLNRSRSRRDARRAARPCTLACDPDFWKSRCRLLLQRRLRRLRERRRCLTDTSQNRDTKRASHRHAQNIFRKLPPHLNFPILPGFSAPIDGESRFARPMPLRARKNPLMLC